MEFLKGVTKELVDLGLVNEKIFSDYPELRMYKYKNKVFFKGLWNTHNGLTECRGLVLDDKGNVVALPFEKVFNNGESGRGIRKSAIVKLVEKRNGFFAACSLYQGEVLVSTTGSLCSDFSEMAKEKIDLEAAKASLEGMEESLGGGMKGTMMFEICHENDPHIVAEEIGAYLIGYRIHTSGLLVPEDVLDRVANAYNSVAMSSKKVMRPSHIYCSFKKALRKLKTCRHEGYMAYQRNSTRCVKLKSPYYLTKKFIMRMSEKKVEHMFDDSEKAKETMDEEFYGFVDYITGVFQKSEWSEMTDQDRRNAIEGYFYGSN